MLMDGTATHVTGEDNTLDWKQKKGGRAGVDGSALTQTVITASDKRRQLLRQKCLFPPIVLVDGSLGNWIQGADLRCAPSIQAVHVDGTLQWF
jgi:hypothetical protein